MISIIRGLSMGEILIRGADHVLTMNDAREELCGADILLRDGVIAAIRTSSGDEKNLLRTRLLELLDTLPANDPDALAARRNLATALY